MHGPASSHSTPRIGAQRFRKAQFLLLACAALLTSGARSERAPFEGREEREAEEREHGRYDKPSEAQEFFARKRAPLGERAIPVERYLIAKRRMDGMRRFSTRERRFLAWPQTGADGLPPSPEAIAEARAESEFVGGWTWLGPGNVGGRTRALVIDPVSTNTM